MVDEEHYKSNIPEPMSPAAVVADPFPPRRPLRPTRAVPPLPCDAHDLESPSQTVPLSAPLPAVLAEPTPASDLTPLRAHYLKKSLIQLQFSREIDAITANYPTTVSTLSFLGQPFSPPTRDANPYLDLPFLRYVFRQFILTFPFMASAPRNFYSEKLQPFVTSALSRNLSPTSVIDDDGNSDMTSELATRQKLMVKVGRNMSMFLSSATKLVEREEVVRLNQADLDRIEALAKKMSMAGKTKVTFEVNVIGVRTIVDRGRVRTRFHDEFIIRTRRSGLADVFVSRRYGDFRTLAAELQKAHPDQQIRHPPVKDRTVVLSTQGNMTDSDEVPPSPGRYSLQLAREKNRLTLRSYLYTLLASPAVSSPVLKSFLLSGHITPTREEMDDIRRREEADRIREDGRQKFANEVARRVEGLREAVKSVKGDIMGKDGLTNIFGIIKVTPDIRDLPPNYKAVVEWARISLASTVFHQYVASDNSSESFANLKRIHGLMPYFMMKTVLKITNPVAMIRGILDVFLAQPFGGRSLLQRMFSSSLAEEVKVLEEQIEAVKVKVDDPALCAKIRQFVYAPKEIQDMYKADAVAENMNVLIVILRAPDEPILSRTQLHRLARARRAHSEYLKQRAELDDSDDDDGPQNEDAWLLEDLKILTHLYSKLRDREQLIELIFEGSTADLLKDIITIFYAPLAQVYRAASVADSIGDLQNFMNDLIRTVDQVEELSQEDPQRTVQAFIDLIQRHEQSFYYFVHKVHSKGENLFTGLMRWIEMFLTIVREGLGSQISLECLLPHTGEERESIMREVDRVALHHYKLKVAYEAKIRRRFRRMQATESSVDAEEEATQEFVNGILGDIDFGDLIRGDVDELAAEESDDDSEEYDDESEESSTDDSSDDEDSEDEESSTDESLPTPRSTVSRSEPSPSASRRQHTVPARSYPVSLQSPHSIQFSRYNQDLPALPTTPRSATSELWTKPLPQSPSSGQQSPPGLPAKTSSQMAIHRTQSRESYEASIKSSSISISRAPPPPVDKGPTGPFSPSGLRGSPSRQSLQSSHDRVISSSPPIRRKGKKRKEGTHTPKPPDLEYIPKVLPIFIEMMRPLLVPRKVNDR